MWCHQCKQKHNDILYCSKYYSGSCTKKYCKGCIERHYNESYSSIDQEKWICLFCRNLCVCAFCRRKRGEAVPKKVFKRKKSVIKESPPPSPQKKKMKKVKKENDYDRDFVVHSSSLSSSGSLSPPSPTIKQDSESTDESISNTHENLSDSNNSICKSSSSICKSNIVERNIVERNIVEREIVSLTQLMDNNLIHAGDKIVLVQKTCFSGEIQKNGTIKLEWCNQIVNNLTSFCDHCRVKYTDECLDLIYCNGFTLRHYIDSFHLLNPSSLLVKNNTSSYSFINLDNFNFEQNNNVLDLLCDGIDHAIHDLYDNMSNRENDGGSFGFQYIDNSQEILNDNMFSFDCQMFNNDMINYNFAQDGGSSILV